MAASEAKTEDLSNLLGSLQISSDSQDGTTTKRELSSEEEEKRECWRREQEEMKLKLVEVDSREVQSWRKGDNPFAGLHHIAGVDISFEKDSPTSRACAMLTLLAFPSLEVVHVSSAMVEMTEPYIPGFLAFREVGFLMERLEAVREYLPLLSPQVIMVDGNGILHPRGFGLACHLGVLSRIPCVGVGKKLFHVDGLEKGGHHKQQVTEELRKKGDHFLLKGTSGRVWGAALRTSNDAPNPVYVSVGHNISLETAVRLTVASSVKRVPEPIRQADIQSRELLRIRKPELTAS